MEEPVLGCSLSLSPSSSVMLAQTSGTLLLSVILEQTSRAVVVRASPASPDCPPFSKLLSQLLLHPSVLVPTFLCVILDYWAGKSPKSALLKAVRPHFSHYAVLFLLTKWKMFQTFLILIKRISASVAARPFHTHNCSPDQRHFFLFFFFRCTVDPH